MEITFLLGNGFDIGLKMKTRYEDFYKDYCKIKKDDNENIQAFKNMLAHRNEEKAKKIIDWADFEKAFGEHSVDFSLSTKLAYIERFEHFVRTFNEYLENEEMHVDYSKSERIAKTMKNAITHFYHIRPEDREWLSRFISGFGGPHTYNFVSFNYTKCVDRCVEETKAFYIEDNSFKIGTVMHVHGYIEDSMIMGVNDASQITQEELANDPDVQKRLIKPKQNSIGKTLYDSKMESVINRSTVICVYGMSIGDTDAKWWHRISQWLAANDRRALVILKHDSAYNQRFIFSQSDIVDSITDRFLSFSKLKEDEKGKIMGRIFVGVNHDIFSIPLRIDQIVFESKALQSMT